MKKSSKKSTKKNFFNNKNITWFGIDIHHIALGVSVVGCLVIVLLIQKQRDLTEHATVLADQTNTTVPFVKVGGDAVPPCVNCPLTPPVHTTLTCIPRPPCLNATPRCLIAEPVNGWCPPTGIGTPTPTSTTNPPVTPPVGCYFRKICVMVACPATGNCNNCRQVLLCPSGTPTPHPSCSPTPTCNPKLGVACRVLHPCTQPTPIVKPTCTQRPPCLAGKACPALDTNIVWCSSTISAQQVTSNTTSTSLSSIMLMWNNFLRGILGVK